MRIDPPAMTEARWDGLWALYRAHPEPVWSSHRTDWSEDRINGRVAQVLVDARIAQRNHDMDGGAGLAITLTPYGYDWAKAQLRPDLLTDG